MRIPIAVLATAAIAFGGMSINLSAQRPDDAQEHQQHQAAAPPTTTTAKPQMHSGMSNMAEMSPHMRANDAKIDQLLAKMRAATGAAKTDAVAELVTVLLEERKSVCEPMMAHMTSMMSTTGASATSPVTPAAPSK
jgi:hypothetical protein